jgi:IclR family acetate operon transcriptional repressor
MTAVEMSQGGRHLSELSTELGLNKSTVLRILRTLVAERVLTHDASTGLYRPDTSSWAYFTPRLTPVLSLLSDVQAWLDRLSESAGATAIVALPCARRQYIVSAMHALPHAGLAVDPLPRGRGTVPLHATAAGKCYLAALPSAELTEYLEAGLAPASPYTITSPRVLGEQLQAVGKQGYAVAEQEGDEGVSALAVSLYAPSGAAVGGLALAFLETTAERAVLSFLPALRDAAEGVSDLMTYDSWLKRVRDAHLPTPPLASPWDTADPGFGDGPTPYVRSVARAIRLMATLFAHPEGLSLAELARRRQLDQTSTLRLLETLSVTDTIWRDAPQRRYRASPTFWMLRARLLGSAVPTSQALDAILQDVANATGATANLAVAARDRRRIASFRFALPAVPVYFDPRRARSVPMHATATGKCLLASCSRRALSAYAESGLATPTENSITSLGRLRQELEDVRGHGYALNREEAWPGVGAVAVPVTDGNAAVGLTVLIRALTQKNIEKWLPLLRNAAAAISPLL